MDTKVFAKIKAYNDKKIRLVQNLQDLTHANDISISLGKNTSNLFRNAKNSRKKINVRHFNQVIQVDTQNMFAEVEGMTTYEDLVKETLKYGCLPTVVPELKTITIGGALAGCGIESSSFRYGLVHETILEYEILLGDGQVVTCTPINEYKDLYFSFPNSYGTLGYALKVKVKLIPAKKFIKLTHVRLTSADQYFKQLEKLCLVNREKGNIAYIDGVIFHKNNMIITLGEFVDTAPHCSNYKYMQIYYRSLLQKQEDYLKTEDYIWRWDTDWFWCSKHFFMQNKIMRFLFGKWFLNSRSFWQIRHLFNVNKFLNKITAFFEGKTETIIQDIEVPIDNAHKFLDFFQKEIDIKPIWVCPTYSFQSNVIYPFYRMDPNKLYINFGFWDTVPTEKQEGFYNKKIEAMVQFLEGNKSLYSHVYYTETEFWKIYDKELYTHLKKQYDPHGNLSDLYEKCKS